MFIKNCLPYDHKKGFPYDKKRFRHDHESCIPYFHKTCFFLPKVFWDFENWTFLKMSKIEFPKKVLRNNEKKTAFGNK